MNKPPKYWNKAKKYLSKKDRVMKTLIEKYKHKTLTSRKDIFFSLCKSIIGQQISVAAANSVFKKFKNTCDGKINPKAIKIIKYLKVFSQSKFIKLYFVNKGDKKYPIEAAAVTIPVAIVLVSLGKCFPVSETGTPIAVAPKAIPTKTPSEI